MRRFEKILAVWCLLGCAGWIFVAWLCLSRHIWWSLPAAIFGALALATCGIRYLRGEPIPRARARRRG